MADHGKDDFRADVKKAVDAGSDLSQGGEHAYKNLMAELAKDQAKYAKDPAKFDQLGKAVADGLAANNVIDSHMLRWSRDNMSRFSTGDKGEVNAIEMDPRAPGNSGHLNGFETAMMSRFQSTYAELQHDAPKTFWGNDKDAFSQKDFNALIAQREKPIQEASDRRQQDDLAMRKDAQRSEVTASLLRNDGDPRHSLAAVLDNIRGGKPDGEISHRDVRQFIANYPAGSSRGDFGYNEANLKAAQLLDAQWDNALGTSLRGQYKDTVGHSDQMRTHDHIDLTRLAQMNNFQSADAMMAAYGSGGAPDGRALRSVSANQPDAAVVPQVAGDGNTALRPVRQDANVLVSGDGQPVLDGSGNPVRTGADLPPRPVRQDANAMPPDAPVDGPVDGNTRPVRPHRSERHYATRGIKPPVEGDPNGATDQAPRPVRPTNGDADGAVDQAPRPTRQDVSAKPAVPGKDPNDVPELQAPDIKLDGDMAKQRADFQKQVGDYLSAKSQYTPTPGQGWDRIARDLMRRAGGDDWKNEVQVESLSDQIAKLNGRDGRLDANGRPRLGEPVRVLSDDQIKAAGDELMKRFDAKVEEMKAATAKDGSADPQLFDDKRNAIPAAGDKAQPADPAAATDKAQPVAPAAATDKAQPVAPAAATDKAQPVAPASSDAAGAARSVDQAIPAKPAPPAYTGDAGKTAVPAAPASDAAKVQADLKAGKQVGVSDIASPNADDGVAPTSAREAELARQQAAKDKAAREKAAKDAANASGLGLDTDSWTVG